MPEWVLELCSGALERGDRSLRLREGGMRGKSRHSIGNRGNLVKPCIDRHTSL